MSDGLVKIPLMAEELGITTKTLYNWINSGKLVMPTPGFVNQTSAYEVWLQQKSLKSIQSYFMAIKIPRDASGKFFPTTD
jgi:predicted DNA-binding transcriptional regulator AlpA